MKTFTDQMGRALYRNTLNGATMGTRYSSIFYAPASLNIDYVAAALFEAVDQVDNQMSTWKPSSDLMRINDAELGDWLDIPDDLAFVLKRAIDIGQASDNCFNIGVGELVDAWGFGPVGRKPDDKAIRSQLGHQSRPVEQIIDLVPEEGRVKKLAPCRLDLSGIAKGYGVDKMMSVLCGFGIEHALVGLDGELKACGLKADGTDWAVAVEKPDYEVRQAHGVIALSNSAVATSGDYRHFVDVGQTRLAHTMHPDKGGPVSNRLASVSVVTKHCIDADAWATALMVMGETEGVEFARAAGLNALFIVRDRQDLQEITVGDVFE